MWSVNSTNTAESKAKLQLPNLRTHKPNLAPPQYPDATDANGLMRYKIRNYVRTFYVRQRPI